MLLIKKITQDQLWCRKHENLMMTDILNTNSGQLQFETKKKHPQNKTNLVSAKE